MSRSLRHPCPAPYTSLEVRIQDGARLTQQRQVFAVSEIGHSDGPRQPVGMLRQEADMNASPTEPPAVTAIRMTMGHWVAQCVSVACELRIPDLVAGGPRTAGELAETCGADPGAMLRLLRALASLEVLAQTGNGKFEATPLSEQFRQDLPSIGPYARFVTGPESWRAWGELLEAVRTGRTAFELVYGMGLFDYGREHPERGRIFNQAMTSFNVAVAEEIVDAYDFSRFGRIVDVGGGQGLLLAAILRRQPLGDPSPALGHLGLWEPGVVTQRSGVDISDASVPRHRHEELRRFIDVDATSSRTLVATQPARKIRCLIGSHGIG